MVSHHPANFDDHRHYDGGEIMFLICHVILQDHVSQEARDFVDKSPSR